ncbi:MAG TPA: deoxyguanosinetriphosphate triphosphohydrolase [Gammaproteobacteria bacterium]|nr:deoxyguanosinetriphosphate triphosphohydrolase [Gammaproteobacteria bacterium]
MNAGLKDSTLSPHAAPYAADDRRSQGRRHPETIQGYRNEYQRDRDRIIHSAAFRRLEYKTQVFVNHEGDLFRTRLTHSLEVAQIARSVARTLQLHEDLVEAISLAHDLGHTPFGHAGQEALHERMRDYGGFEHNLQSLRVVDLLEERYAEFDGLNLMFETREGILKHCSQAVARTLGDVGERFLKKRQPSLEAQLANLCDEIAYNNHDVDDGLRSGLITLQQLLEIRIFGEEHAVVSRLYPRLHQRRLIHEIVRRMINRQINDLIDSSRQSIRDSGVRSIEEVRAQSIPLLRFGEGMQELHLELKQFLRAQLYRHHQVYRMTAKARRVIHEIFDAYMQDPLLLPADYTHRIQDRSAPGLPEEPEARKARVIADYIAGMTDRYALTEHDRLFNPKSPA